MNNKVNFPLEMNERGFDYVDMGFENHLKPTFRLWVNKALISKDKEKPEWEKISFPVLNSVIHQTEKGTIILVPSNDFRTEYVLVKCGYRGSSDFEFKLEGPFTVFPFFVWDSPRGNLGISKGCLISVPKNSVLSVKWQKHGRLYGSPAEGVVSFYPDGKIENFDNLPDEDEVKKLGDLL